MPSGKHPTHRGWPRRKVRWFDGDEDANGNPTYRMLPNLWIGGRNQIDGDWLSFQDGRERTAVVQRRCVVCGEAMEGTIVFGRYGGDKVAAPIVNGVRRWNRKRESRKRLTDGPGGHPRCIKVAVNTCPHFAKHFDLSDPRAVIAYRYDGDGCGIPAATDAEGRYVEGGTSPARVSQRAKALTYPALDALAKERPLG